MNPLVSFQVFIHDDNETLPPEHNESEIGAFEIMLSNNRILENEAPGSFVGEIYAMPLYEYLIVFIIIWILNPLLISNF